MPLRDHFQPPLDNKRHWEGFHAQWCGMMVLALAEKLPQCYAPAPRIEVLEEYEVHVFDNEQGRRLVAAIEIVCPANKDRLEHRRAFIAKCAAFLQNRVSVTIIDLVTTRNFNLYHDLLELIGLEDPSLGHEPPPLYASASRATKKGESWLLETWAHTLTLGNPLPTLPLWLADNLAVPLELEASYEDTCRSLRIP